MPAPEKQNHSGKTNLDLLEQEIVSGSGIRDITFPVNVTAYDFEKSFTVDNKV